MSSFSESERSVAAVRVLAPPAGAHAASDSAAADAPNPASAVRRVICEVLIADTSCLNIGSWFIEFFKRAPSIERADCPANNKDADALEANNATKTACRDRKTPRVFEGRI